MITKYYTPIPISKPTPRKTAVLRPAIIKKVVYNTYPDDIECVYEWRCLTMIWLQEPFLSNLVFQTWYEYDESDMFLELL